MGGGELRASSLGGQEKDCRYGDKNRSCYSLSRWRRNAKSRGERMKRR